MNTKINFSSAMCGCFFSVTLYTYINTPIYRLLFRDIQSVGVENLSKTVLPP